jgi:phage terminase large subunit-like protein
MSKKQQAEITLDDPNIPVKDWEEYKKLVNDGVLEEPKEVVVKTRPDYSFNVDMALDNIDLKFNGYTPSTDAIEFFNVIRLVLGSEPEVPNSLMHYFLVDLVFGNIKREQYPYSKDIRDKIRINERKIAIIAARGTAKSTILTTYLPVYLAIKGTMPNFGKVSFIVAFGDSQLGGAKVIAQSVRALCEDSDFCSEYFEHMRFTDDECEFIRRGRGKIKNKSFMYKTKGASAGVRGIRYRGERPAILLMDDIIKNEADASSPIIMKKLRSMIFADAENALSGNKGKIIAINTPFNKKDPIYSALESGVWTPVCLPICEKMDLDLQEKDYVGAWPQMHPYHRIKERFEDAYYGGTLREFNQELMLRISSGEDRLVSDDMIQWYDRSSIIKNLSNFNVLITTDFTASNTKTGDYSGIAVWAIGADDDKFLLDLELKRRSIQDQYNALFRMVSKWGRGGRVLEVGMEIDGQQQLNLFALKRMMIEKNIWFRFARQKGASANSEGILSKAAGGNKLERFKYMMPSFEQKKIWFPNELKASDSMKEMLEELRYVTHTAINSKHDDGLDLISQLGMIDYILPANGVDLSEDEELTSVSESIWGSVGDEEEIGSSVIF